MNNKTNKFILKNDYIKIYIQLKKFILRIIVSKFTLYRKNLHWKEVDSVERKKKKIKQISRETRKRESRTESATENLFIEASEVVECKSGVEEDSLKRR